MDYIMPDGYVLEFEGRSINPRFNHLTIRFETTRRQNERQSRDRYRAVMLSDVPTIEQPSSLYESITYPAAWGQFVKWAKEFSMFVTDTTFGKPATAAPIYGGYVLTE